MTQQLTTQDTANLEIIEDASGLDEATVMDIAENFSANNGDTVSEELAEGARELSDPFAGDDADGAVLVDDEDEDLDEIEALAEMLGLDGDEDEDEDDEDIDGPAV